MRKAARIGTVAGTVAVLGAGLVAPAAHADPVAPPPPTPVSAKALPTWQINGVAWSQAIVGNTVYVVGDFTKARPPGVAVGGAGEVDALNIFAYDITTGDRVASFNHSLNAQGLVVRASPDGSRIYVGGDFTTVDGQPRGHVAAFNTADGSLVTGWAPNIGGQVRALAITSDTVYVGGNFPSANGELRTSLAAFGTSGSAIKPWAPTATGTGGYVWAMTMAPDNSRVIVGGSFSLLNGVDAYGMGSLDAATGAVLPWAATQRIRTAGLNGGITSLKTDGISIFGSGYAFGSGATFEGTFSADPYTGAINWVNDCLGDTYDVLPKDDVLYAVSHSHNCTAINEFPDTSPRVRWMKATAAPIQPTGVITVKDAYGWDFRGLPYAGLLQWYPDLEFGRYTSSRQAAWSVEGSGSYVALAGEFPIVNGVAQQGLTRFAYRGVAGPSQKPIYSTGMTPVATSTEAGVVRVRWQATWDRDDKNLTYDIYRDNGPSLATLTQSSIFWNMPSMGFYDTGRTPGATHTYKIRAKDSDGNVQWSLTSAPVTVSDAAVPAYLQTLRNDNPTHVWRLGEVGPSFVDSAQFGDGTSTGATFGVSGVLGDDTAVSAGAASTKVYTTSTEAHPAAVTVETWVKTTSPFGGRIIGFGDSVSGTSVNTDMVLYLANTGRVNFALNNGSWRGVQSARPINDGQWHHVVATADAGGVSLFVDGRRVGRDQTPVAMGSFVGSWRMFSDTTTGLPNRPSNSGLVGSVDEVAVYPTALSQSAIQGHYLASGRSANWAAAPADAYGAAVATGSPELFWRLDQAWPATTAPDASTSGDDGTISGGVTYDVSGAISGNSAMTFNGASGLVVSKESWNNPTAYSAELWFKSSSTNGGKLIGFGNATSGLSSSYDRQVVLLSNGRLQFGANNGGQVIAETTTSYNDNAWHHVVATQGPDGMKLYVDALLVASNPNTGAQNYVGYWRIGGDRTWGGTRSNYVNATIDEPAVFARVLPLAEIEQHYAASGRLLPNKLPTAVIGHSEHFLTASFDGSGSTDPDGSIVNYAWTFGDGATATGATTAHAYSAAGSYPVTLTVTDDRGGTATSSTTVVVVANQPPMPAFTDSSSFLIVSVDGGGTSDVDGEITSYAWDFGDGSTATGATASHTYAAAGSYPVTLTVTDTGGATATLVRTLTVVANQAPTASFTTTVTDLQVSADGSTSADPDGAVASYAWDFGDGGTATGASATHSYADTGTFTVTLTVTDDQGVTGTTSQQVSVTAPPNQLPTAGMTTSASFLTLGVDGSTSSDPDGTIVGYAWDFGDGATGSGATASHSYDAAGTYTVTLTVTDNRGGTATASSTVAVVANQAPVADFTHQEDFLVMTVNAASSSDAEGPIAGYAWSFGDGTNASGATATKTYAAAGTYQVTLTVTDGAGATSSTTTTVVVAANPAYAMDAFGRTVTGGWGSADLGGAWTVSGTASRYSVSSGSAKVSLVAGGGGTTSLPGVTNSNTEVALAVATDKAPTGGGQYLSVIGRSVGTSDYRAKLRLAAGGAVTVSLVRTDAGVETTIGTANVAGWTYSTGDVVQVRFQVNGTSPTSLQAKVWKRGTTEPATWTLTGSDNSANLQTTGSVGIYSYVSGSATNAPVVFAYDDVWVGPVRP